MHSFVCYKRERVNLCTFWFDWDNPRETSSNERRPEKALYFTKVKYQLWHQGKMTILLILIALVCGTSTISIMPELKHNVLRFGYGVNFRYEGMLSHSFDRFYVVTRIEIPKASDLNLTLFQFDYNCCYVVNIEKDTSFKVPSTIKDMFNIYCKILFHICICINIKWNIMRKWYMIFWKRI